jgi:hypothetical protein
LHARQRAAQRPSAALTLMAALDLHVVSARHAATLPLLALATHAPATLGTLAATLLTQRPHARKSSAALLILSATTSLPYLSCHCVQPPSRSAASSVRRDMLALPRHLHVLTEACTQLAAANACYR